jgi:tetratricopeptide (TPR) repeat protein
LPDLKSYPQKIGADSLAELGGYLMDKRTEEVTGVPNEYVEEIQGVRDVLLRAVKTDPAVPEAHYHLSRYYRNLSSLPAEQAALETAIRAFDGAKEESVKRLAYRIAAQQRYANILTGRREFFAAEDQLIKGIGLYEDGLTRRLLNPSPEYGKLYADMGDLEYFTKAGDLEMALQYYLRSEQNGWAPPEIQYRMGAVHYRRQQWTQALERFFAASSELPLNRRILLALGNSAYQRSDYFAAQGYYNRLLDILEGERARLPMLMPNDHPEFIDLAERLMITRNNMGVTLEALSRSLGSIQPRVLDRYRSRALGLYTESARAWDSLTRNPVTMLRLGAGDLSTPGINLAFLNSRNALYPVPDYEPQLYLQIDKDVLEPSIWEDLSAQAVVPFTE